MRIELSGSDDIRIIDRGSELRIGYEDCARYHGRSSIGGVALGFRLMQRALAELCPQGAIPDRAAVTAYSAFPGEGVRDALEMIARVVTRGVYRVAPAADVPGPSAAVGRLYFEIGYDGRRTALAVAPGVMGEDFIALGRRNLAGALIPTEAARFQEMKEALARAALAMPLDRLFRAVGPRAAAVSAD